MLTKLTKLRNIKIEYYMNSPQLCALAGRWPTCFLHTANKSIARFLILSANNIIAIFGNHCWPQSIAKQTEFIFTQSCMYSTI